MKKNCFYNFLKSVTHKEKKVKYALFYFIPPIHFQVGTNAATTSPPLRFQISNFSFTPPGEHSDLYSHGIFPFLLPQLGYGK